MNSLTLLIATVEIALAPAGTNDRASDVRLRHYVGTLTTVRPPDATTYYHA